MKTSTTMFETYAFDVRNLDQEHAEIRRLYSAIERAILRGQEMSGILKAADGFVQMMLLHFTHEEQLLLKLPFSSRLRKKLSGASREVTERLIAIEVGLEQGKTAAVFHLLRLGRFWMKEHMHLESVESDCWLPVESSNRAQSAGASELPMPRSV